MDTLSIMDLAAEVEDQLAQLYHAFSRRFTANPEGYTFWEKLSHDEKKHADIVRTYRRQRIAIPCHILARPEILSDLRRIKNYTLEHLENDQLWEHISSALGIAFRIESMLAHVHLDQVSKIIDPTLTKVFMRLGRDDNEHQAMIKKMAVSFPES